MLLLYTLTLYR